ncbi:MAG: diaminopimelate decarboxylase [Candidatus Omnitrophota bacterium]|nr:diaminopimelate decarboxylase [Candidatus Omnitrophota bacterium]
MHDFHFKNNNLFCESVRVKEIARKVGTPFYLYSYKTLIDHLRKLQLAFREIDPLICYSVKANPNSAILRALVKKGAGLDIVSGGELFKALRSGCDPKKIVYASVGKTESEIRQAIQKGILFFNVESIPELETINSIAMSLKKTVQVAIRINPDVEPHTHKFITTGKLTNKFGIDFITSRKIFQERYRFSNVRINGLHIHIGSQIIQASPFISAIKRVTVFAEDLRRMGVRLEYLNIGGGLGIIYKNEKPQTAAEFSRVALPLLIKTGLKIILEPGRFIVGNAGILVAKVLYIKKSKLKTFAIVDAGMNDLIRPALYDAYHEIVPIRANNYARVKYDIVGPICESADFLAKDRMMPKLAVGDILAVMGAGAYGFSMSSNYNQRLRPPEVMVAKNKFFITRKREKYSDLLKGEVIPQFLK